MTDPVDALEVAAQQDAYFASTGKLIGPLHGIVFSIKDQYDTFDMRTTEGMDAAYANEPSTGPKATPGAPRVRYRSWCRLDSEKRPRRWREYAGECTSMKQELL
jgi:hypothetical protein